MSATARPARVWARRAAETVLWAAACFSLWLLTLSSVNKQDIVAAAAASVPCGLMAVLARQVVRGAWRFELRPLLRFALLLPVAIVLDTVRLLLVPLRVLAGRVLPGKHEPGAGQQSR